MIGTIELAPPGKTLRFVITAIELRTGRLVFTATMQVKPGQSITIPEGFHQAEVRGPDGQIVMASVVPFTATSTAECPAKSEHSASFTVVIPWSIT